MIAQGGRRMAFFPLQTDLSISGRVGSGQNLWATLWAALFWSALLLGVSRLVLFGFPGWALMPGLWEAWWSPASSWWRWGQRHHTVHFWMADFTCTPLSQSSPIPSLAGGLAGLLIGSLSKCPPANISSGEELACGLHNISSILCMVVYIIWTSRSILQNPPGFIYNYSSLADGCWTNLLNTRRELLTFLYIFHISCSIKASGTMTCTYLITGLKLKMTLFSNSAFNTSQIIF